MQKILVPVDFSDPSIHAARYAVSLARQTRAQSIILFHAYGLPNQVNSTLLAMLPTEPLDVGDNIRDSLSVLKQDLQSMLVEYVNIETLASPLTFLDALQETLLNDPKIQLVVMGITGKSPMGQRFIGSNALDAVHAVMTPVVIVPHTAEFRKVHHIVFAYNKKQPLQEAQASVISELLSSLQARIEAVHVVTGEVTGEAPATLINGLHIPPEAYHEIQHTDLVQGIHDFAAEVNADMLLAIPGEYGFFAELFHTSITKKLAYDAAVPVLVVK